MRAGSGPLVTFGEAQRLAARAGGRLASKNEMNPFPPKGDPKPGEPS
jgi:hypothetical protein